MSMDISTVTMAASQTTQLQQLNKIQSSDEKDNKKETGALSAVPQYDQVEISSAGLAAVAQMEAAEQEDGASTSTDAEAAAQTTVTDFLNESEEESEVDTTQLYSYTSSELSELLRSGDITQAQYEKELARRGEGTEE